MIVCMLMRMDTSSKEIILEMEIFFLPCVWGLQCNQPDNKHPRGHIKLVVAGRMLIPKTCLYNFDPLKPHFYIVKLGFTRVYIIFLISAQKHRLWVLVRTASLRQF